MHGGTLAGVVRGWASWSLARPILAFGAYGMGSDIDALRTLAFIVIVFGNQTTTYTNRDRRHLWSSRPSGWLIVSSIVDLALASTLAVADAASGRIPIEAFVAAIVFAFVQDLAKYPVFWQATDHLESQHARRVCA